VAWTAEAISNTFKAGSAVVVLRFTDGTDTLDEVYRSTNPTAEWIPKTARDRIAQLTAAKAFSITPGPITPADPDPGPDGPHGRFIHRMRLLTDLKAMVDLGVLPADNLRIVALTAWLQGKVAAHWDRYTG